MGLQQRKDSVRCVWLTRLSDRHGPRRLRNYPLVRTVYTWRDLAYLPNGQVSSHFSGKDGRSEAWCGVQVREKILRYSSRNVTTRKVMASRGDRHFDRHFDRQYDRHYDRRDDRLVYSLCKSYVRFTTWSTPIMCVNPLRSSNALCDHQNWRKAISYIKLHFLTKYIIRGWVPFSL